MLIAPTPPPIIDVQAAIPVIDLALAPSSSNDLDAIALKNKLWLRLFYAKTVYFYVDGTGSFLEVIIDVRANSLRKLDAKDVIVDYRWGKKSVRTVTYRCKQQDLTAGCMERIFQTVRRIAPTSVKSAPPKHLIF